MNNLRGSLVSRTKVEEAENADLRYLPGPYGKTKEERISSACCICLERIWVESRESCVWMHEAFLIIDPRAYVGGTPDYLKYSNVLLHVHYGTCQEEMNKRLNSGQFLEKPQ
jgi:hypothetical protein